MAAALVVVLGSGRRLASEEGSTLFGAVCCWFVGSGVDGNTGGGIGGSNAGGGIGVGFGILGFFWWRRWCFGSIIVRRLASEEGSSLFFAVCCWFVGSGVDGNAGGGIDGSNAGGGIGVGFGILVFCWWRRWCFGSIIVRRLASEEGSS